MEQETLFKSQAYELNQQLLHFIQESPNSFFAAASACKLLNQAGYTRLFEDRPWQLEAGHGYYVVRGESAVIAFCLPTADFTGFQILAAHGDSPAFKIKPNAEIEFDQKYIRLNVEKYGGMLCAPWFDRPLSVAGRVVVDTPDGVRSVLINIDQDLLVIPSAAIHINRNANEGASYNAQKDMQPLFGGIDQKGGFLKLVAAQAGVKPEEVLDTDLWLYSRTPGTLVGPEGEYICSGRLDDLQCAFACLIGFLKAEPRQGVPVYCLLDHEEVGSGTSQGACGTFLKDVLTRINQACGRTAEQYNGALHNSLMVSADNAHSVHPNMAEKADPTNRPCMNKGIVIKYSANQKYTTDAISGALFRKVCARAGVPVQTFANRADQPGGSTLGNLSTSQVSIKAVDVGLAQLAMHSACETAGCADTVYLARAAKVFADSWLQCGGDGNIALHFSENA